MTPQQDEQDPAEAAEPAAAAGDAPRVEVDGFDVDPGTDVDPDDDDLAFAPTARSGIGRVTGGLLVGIALVAAFGGGVYVQKQQTPAAGSTAAAARGGFARAGGFGGAGAEGFPGFPGGGAAPGAAPVTGTGSTGTGSAGSTGTAAAGPAVIGTVVKVSGNTVTVRNFAGKTITVTVPDGAAVTQSKTLTVSGLKKGASVTVNGTTAADGTVTATAVTAR